MGRLHRSVLVAGVLATGICAFASMPVAGEMGSAAEGAPVGPASPAASGRAVGQASGAAPTVLGTIRASVDGVPHTWYVISGTIGARPYASGMWREGADGDRRIYVGGFDTATPPLDTFEMSDDGMPLSYGDYKGSVALLVFALGPDPAPFREVFPAESAATVMYVSEATFESLDTTFSIEEGALDVSAAAIGAGLASASGTFAGTFARIAGEGTVEITDGTFEVTALPDFVTLR